MNTNTDISTLRQHIVDLVNAIPRGRVASYGVIGFGVGVSGWQVGRILSNLPQEQWGDVAWQRVVAKNGFISSLKLGFRGRLHKELLAQEGIAVVGDYVDMDVYSLSQQEIAIIAKQRLNSR